MIEYTLIDGFFDNVDVIRDYALSLDYVKSSKQTGWKGYRAELTDTTIFEYIRRNLIEINPQFGDLNLEIYFHYSIDDTKKEIKNFDRNRLHKDATNWAGVIYLSPNPKENSGTTLHSDSGELIHNVENVYNRFVFYKGDTLHGVLDTFGDTIDNARFTITIFGNMNKSIKTLI